MFFFLEYKWLDVCSLETQLPKGETQQPLALIYKHNTFNDSVKPLPQVWSLEYIKELATLTEHPMTSNNILNTKNTMKRRK